MSCQQLIQEDPYVFTDTVSSSATFLQHNNSQTKYVPLNRQTIYSRQFRQHEPTIALSENISINGLLQQHQKFSPPGRRVNNSFSGSHKKNGFTNGSATKSPRTSPKFFKSHQQQHLESFKSSDGEFLVNNCNDSSTTHHSITVSAQSDPSIQQKHPQENSTSQLNHVASACENGISNNTGIKPGPLGKSQAINNRGKVEKFKINGKVKSKSVKSRINSKTLKKQQKFSVKPYSTKWQAMHSQNVIVEALSQSLRFAPEVQSNSDLYATMLNVPPLCPLNHIEIDTASREERMAHRKMQLQHRIDQFKGIQRYRTTESSKLRFSETLKLLEHLERSKEQIFKRQFKPCQFDNCTNESIFNSLHCIDHVLLADREQHLIRQCCFLHSNGEQCRVPVHDVMATIAVCNEHYNAVSCETIQACGLIEQKVSWQPAHQLIDPAKPKKTTQVSRKRTNKAPMIRPVKKNGKNGKKKLTSLKPLIAGHRPTMIIHPNDIHKPVKVTMQQQQQQQQLQKQEVPEHHQFIHHNSGNLLASSQSSYGSITSTSDDLYLKQDLMTMCENSYGSSEDTGVGGLSENELMPHDVIGPFDMESCAELTKVLSSLPTNTLDDLLTEPLQTSRDDEEYLDRAIEEVSSVGMDQIAITAFDHLDGLGDMLEMMDDEEQRQMISAATNLISMSGMQGFLSNHEDYAAMPSPMMS